MAKFCIHYANGEQFGGAHDIGQNPDLVYFELTNVSAESGYSPGDKVQINYVALGAGDRNEDSYGVTVRYLKYLTDGVPDEDKVLADLIISGLLSACGTGYVSPYWVNNCWRSVDCFDDHATESAKNK